MEDVNRLIRELSIRLKKIAEQTEQEIITVFPPLLSYDLLKGRKRYLSHNFDPPWDSSGTLFSKSTDAKFDVNEYSEVAGFFDEYTGNSMASYMSGCGLFYETYGEFYESWMEEEFRAAHYAVVEGLSDEDLLLLAHRAFGESEFDLEDRHFLVDEIINGIETLEDLSILYAENLRMKIEKMSMQLVYKLGEKQAKEKIYKEKVEWEQEAKQIELEKVTFGKMWSLLEKKYKLANQKPFPTRIEMAEYASFKQFLDYHDVESWERVLIGKYAPISFSNSVESKLTRQ